MADDSALVLTPLEPASLTSVRSKALAAQTDEAVRSYCRILALAGEQPEDTELLNYEQFALLGVSAGFVELNLSPHLPEHAAIVPPLLEEIRSVYLQLTLQGLVYSPEEFRLRAFHYGLHKANYLDWTLYQSKECY